MDNTTKAAPKSKRDIAYYRQRFKNRVFEELLRFFVQEAERTGVTKRDLAIALDKDPAVISRIFKEPGNLTLETISDILLALDAEAEPPQIIRFEERAIPNEMHDLMAKVLGQLPPPAPTPGVPTGPTMSYTYSSKTSTKVSRVRIADAYAG